MMRNRVGVKPLLNVENNPTCKEFTAMRMIKRKLTSYTPSSFCVPENVGVNQKVYSQDK
jgi:hypothetical protein